MEMRRFRKKQKIDTNTMQKVNVEIQNHDGVDKSFDLENVPYLDVTINYDDVDHPSVDAAVRVLKNIIDDHWNETKYQKYFREEVLAEWERNEYGLQDDYEGILTDYLADHGLES